MTIEELQQSGQLFEGWQVKRLIGEGGFGKVYEIERDEFGVHLTAALKLITIPKNPNDIRELMSEGMDEESTSQYFRGFVEDFARECAIMSKLKGNSNIVSFEDYRIIEHTDGIGWDILIRMEKLTPFVDEVNKRTLSRDEVLDVGIAICKALELCGKYNIIHRDIKPANIFISETGDYKLGDFGISRIADESGGASTKVGANDYMAPEVFRGEAYDRTVDLYSLGIMLYRLLNRNRLPFLPPAPEPITHQQREDATGRRLHGEPFPMPQDADEDVFEVLQKATAFTASDRYQSPEEMRAALEEIRFGKAVQQEEDSVKWTPPVIEPDPFEDEETIPAPRPVPQEVQEDEKEVKEDEDDKENIVIQPPVKEKKNVAALVVGIVTGVLTLLFAMLIGSIYFAIIAIGYCLILFILCMVSYNRAKKGKSKPWICYYVGLGLYVFSMLGLWVSGPVLALCPTILTIGLLIMFALLIKDETKKHPPLAAAQQSEPGINQ